MTSSTYTLYYAPGAASLAVHWLLLELGVQFHAIQLDLQAGEHKRPDYLAINPAGLVPTLLVDGKAQSECAALLLLLAERHPASALAPALDDPARGDYLQWTLHLANTLQPAFRTWFYPHEAAGAAHADAAREASRARIEGCWDRLDTWMAQRSYMLGEHLSAVDFLATMLMRWSRNMPKPATEWPHLVAYVQRMKQRPSFAELYAREGLSEWA
jgi:glutathione S-transferase